MASSLALFWVQDFDHSEDCFIVAKSTTQAEKYYHEFEGIDKDRIVAKPVLFIDPNIIFEDVPTHPSEDQIEKMGIEILKRDEPRTFKGPDGKIYKEGMMEGIIQVLRKAAAEEHEKKKILDRQ